MANILARLNSPGLIPGYAPDQIGAEAHDANEPGVIWVDIDYIDNSPYQHQEYIEPADFQALVESIQKEGFLAALNVNERPEQPGYYFLTAGGHQRRDAAKAAGKTRIPVFVEPLLDPKRLAFRAARENAIQVNRNRVNLGYLFLQMKSEFSLSQEEIAAELGTSRDFVATCVLAAKSPPDIQELLIRKPDSVRATGYLRRLDSPEDRAPIIARFLSEAITTDGVKAEVEAILRQRKAHLCGPSFSSSKRGGAATERMEGKDEDISDPGVVAKEALGAGTRRDGNPEMRGTTAPIQGERTEEDLHLHERLGKLSDIVSRLKAYQRMRGQQPPAQLERDSLTELASIVEALLTSR